MVSLAACVILSVVGVGASLWGVRSDMVTQLIAAATTTTLTMAAVSKESGAGNRNNDLFLKIQSKQESSPAQRRKENKRDKENKEGRERKRKKKNQPAVHAKLGRKDAILLWLNGLVLRMCSDS